MNRKRIMTAAAIFILTFAISAQADDKKVFKGNVSANYYSKYVWRGQNVNDTSVLQPFLSGSIYGLTGSFWGNLDLTDDSQTAPDNAGQFSEIDLTLDYSAAVPGTKKMGFSAGVINYQFPHTGAAATTEVYGALSFDVPLKPRVLWYRDVDEIDGSYVQASIGHSMEKVMKWNKDYFIDLTMGGSVAWGSSGYNRGYFDVDANKFNDVTLVLAAPVNLKHVSITPTLNFSTMLSERVGDATFERTNVWFGIGFSKSF